jgi:hypothetical protein
MGKTGEFGNPGCLEGSQDTGIAAAFSGSQVIPHEFPAFRAATEFFKDQACVGDKGPCRFPRNFKPLRESVRITVRQFSNGIYVTCLEFVCKVVVKGRDLGKGFPV